ncbi:MAG: hypothetical protein FWD86_02600 [Firmicutes bacterium]|nr:hypothetical protein [Bacillota bacterium]
MSLFFCSHAMCLSNTAFRRGGILPPEYRIKPVGAVAPDRPNCLTINLI